jgi:hypothetical protein
MVVTVVMAVTVETVQNDGYNACNDSNRLMVVIFLMVLIAFKGSNG